MRTRIDSRLQARPPRRRDGVSLIEIIVAMTLLVVVLGALSVLTTRTVKRSRDLDIGSARTFVLMEQSNRFSSLPYDSIPTYAPRIDTIATGRYKYERRLTYVQGSTGSEYRTLKVMLKPVSDTNYTASKTDSLVFQRAKTYATTPLFK
ncbi:MAG: prepilin-type N-terminal cleavage/methylation domain-containing protein [Gemmatimonadaceae bacterium]|nr:prepilin-type N-terminal cleavage/methylation domain-containing protein [Gemmatimonadaceae bacterium]NUO93551.1 prepilin-type N-terminal cleavage/methylation domain-containing protein [Gemmatimonadaceae bacterium]NUP69752.1 prepilin-type N-terminal cleavage/methylation domain-containing protein [Gemmatimonadaceae bacterium]NUR34715.1 prepilin-type N-terminal cleavage/methylation domain-containing protein [Gemmatimonadaceae bacterium]NUS34549.1 prepilin-type N-terminal cleavage/methylation do